MKFGTCWEMVGHTLGAFSDGFGMVSGKSPDEVEHMKFSDLSGSNFPASGLLITIIFRRFLDKHIIKLSI